MTEQEAYTEAKSKVRDFDNLETTRYANGDMKVSIRFGGKMSVFSIGCSLEELLADALAKINWAWLVAPPKPSSGTQIVKALIAFRLAYSKPPICSDEENESTLAAAIDAALKSNSEPC